MRRESDDGFLCGVCLETVYRGECRCNQDTDIFGKLTFQGWLEVCFANYRAPSTASLIQQRSFPSPLVGVHKLAESFEDIL